MRRAYAVAAGCLLPLLLARLAWRGLSNPAYRERWTERFGFYSSPARAPGVVWIHAVSVGEVGAAVPLVKALREREPGLRLLVTTTTPTGREALARAFGPAIEHAWFPYDLRPIVARFLRHFGPRALLLLETELWPEVIEACHARGIPVLVVNGRLSARSARRYAWLGGLARRMLGLVDHVAAQTADDAARFVALGLPSTAVTVTGSLKFDVELPASAHEEGQAVRREIGSDRPVLMAGSTREGEEAIVLAAFARLKARFPDAMLLVAPRHPERFQAVFDLCRRAGLRTGRRRDGLAHASRLDALVIDTMGELLRFYAAADVAFVGGSLLPLGGQNVLEPAGLGIPVITGPHLFNFSEIAELLRAGGALRIVEGAEELAEVAGAWLRDPELRDAAGRAGREIVLRNGGATARVCEIVLARLRALPPAAREAEAAHGTPAQK